MATTDVIMWLSRAMNLPNALTVTRIFLMPLLVVVLLTKFEGRQIFGVPEEIVGAGIFAIASLTDWLDGYLARRRKQVTAFGQVIDPLADKLLVCAALVSLAQLGLAPAWMVWIIIGRELAITAFRGYAYARGVIVAASPLGKVKMVSEVVAVLALILSNVGTSAEMSSLYLIGQIALWVVVATALVSAADYFLRFNASTAPNPRVTDINVAREQRTDRKAG